MGNTTADWVMMSDTALVKQIGHYIRHVRLQQNQTQAQLAQMAGLNRWTISQIENGESITLASLIPILRALDSLYTLHEFEVSDEISPLEYAKLKKKQRKRVRHRSVPKPQKDDSEW